MTARAILVSGMMAMLAAGCASAPTAPEGESWRMLTQSQKRFAVFVNEPGAPRAGDLTNFRLVFVYMPGEVLHEGREVAWQEYSGVTVNCAENTVRLGSRTRYAPDGSVLMSDDSPDFADVVFGTAADDAARAKCRGEYRSATAFSDAAGWMDAARRHIAANEPPPR